MVGLMGAREGRSRRCPLRAPARGAQLIDRDGGSSGSALAFIPHRSAARFARPSHIHTWWVRSSAVHLAAIAPCISSYLTLLPSLPPASPLPAAPARLNKQLSQHRINTDGAPVLGSRVPTSLTLHRLSSAIRGHIRFPTNDYYICRRSGRLQWCVPCCHRLFVIDCLRADSIGGTRELLRGGQCAKGLIQRK